MYKSILYIIALSGALCGATIGFIFPPLVYIVAWRKNKIKKKDNAPSWVGFFFPYFSILAGTFCLLFGTTYVIRDIATGSEDDDGVLVK